MEHTTSSFCYVDDEGHQVPADEESSVLAALGVVPHTMGDDGRSLSFGAAADEDMTEKPYHEDPEVFERERLAACQRLAAADSAPPAVVKVLPVSGATNDDEAERLEEASPILELDVEEEEEGMYERAFSREATSEEDWILDTILERHVVRGGKGGSDYKVFYDDFGDKETGMLAAGRIEYLCKWKGYSDPTWESKEVMEDEGYMKELRTFDEVALSRFASRVTPKWDDLSERDQKLADESASLTGGSGSGPLLKGQAPSMAKKVTSANYYADTSVVEQLASAHFLSDVLRLFRGTNGSVTQYGSIVSQKQIDTFLGTARKLSRTHRPVILFHGTQVHNIPKIAVTGLQVPGNGGVTVVNGSVHGIGIYAANEPGMSIRYCGSASPMRMLVCVGLVSNSDPDITVRADFLVLKRSELILAMWAVDLVLYNTFSDPVCVGFTPSTLGHIGPKDAVDGKQKARKYNAVKALEPFKSAALTKIKKRNIAELLREAEKLRKQDAAPHSPT